MREKILQTVKAGWDLANSEIRCWLFVYSKYCLTSGMSNTVAAVVR